MVFGSFGLRSITALLITGVAITALAGCKRVDELYGDERDPQIVDGPRRPPLLNPQMMAPQSPPMVETVPAPKTPAPQMAAQNNPFDAYDDNGNPVAPKQETSAPVQEDSTFFDRMLSRIDGSSASENAPRKSFRDNPNYSKETVPVAPVPPAPAAEPVMAKPVVLSPVPDEEVAEEVVEPVVAPQAAPAPMMSDSAPQDIIQRDDGVNGPNWFSRVVKQSFRPEESAPETVKSSPQTQLQQPQKKTEAVQVVDDAESPDPVGWFRRMVGAKDADAQAKASGIDPAAETPELSSVPTVPSEFRELKKEQSQNLDELQMDHAIAQEQKHDLDSEPSQVTATPVEEKTSEPADEKSSAPASNVVPIPTISEPPQQRAEEQKNLSVPPVLPVVKIEKPAVMPVPVSANETVLLGHASAPVEAPSKQNAADLAVAPVAKEYTVPAKQDEGEVQQSAKHWGLGDVLSSIVSPSSQPEEEEQKEASSAPVPDTAAPVSPVATYDTGSDLDWSGSLLQKDFTSGSAQQ